MSMVHVVSQRLTAKGELTGDVRTTHLLADHFTTLLMDLAFGAGFCKWGKKFVGIDRILCEYPAEADSLTVLAAIDIGDSQAICCQAELFTLYITKGMIRSWVEMMTTPEGKLLKDFLYGRAIRSILIELSCASNMYRNCHCPSEIDPQFPIPDNMQES